MSVQQADLDTGGETQGEDVFERIFQLQYLQPPWEMEFDSYHQCVPKKDVKIMHR